MSFERIYRKWTNQTSEFKKWSINYIINYVEKKKKIEVSNSFFS